MGRGNDARKASEGISYTDFLATYRIFIGGNGVSGGLFTGLYKYYLDVKNEGEAMRLYRDSMNRLKLAKGLMAGRRDGAKVRLEPKSLEKITTKVLHRENLS